jgi:hypothetical protein
MSRVNRAYSHLMGGVSEQPSEKRGAGEHWLQDNMVSDPVRGLTRRAGGKMVAQSTTDILGTAPDGAETRTYDFQVGDRYYSVVYDTATDGGMKRLIVFPRDQALATPLSVTHAADANVTALLAGGITSATSLGRYVIMAGPGLTPAYTTTEKYGVESNQKHHVLWIRGGAYSRTYRVALVRGNQKLWCEYTTPSASYPVALDTSGLNVNDPDYLKQVNDLTNQYNSAVNAWIASAMAAAQPDAIANTIAEEITNSGFLGSGETAVATGPNVYILAPSVEDVEVDDGGDGSLARGVGNTVPAAELLSLSHIPGKIVRVRPNNSTNGQCFYMEAIAKDGSTGTLTEVAWRECAGTEFAPTAVFGVLAVNDEGTAAYFNTNLVTLAALEAEFADLPQYIPSAAGDIDSNPPQRFLGEPATMLTTFQDRLIVGCNNSVNSSKTSDYFNFFRASIVTVAADDPVNFVTIGGEDDVIRYSLTYDRNLVLWGTGQYLIDGRKPFSPGSVSSVRMASIKDALTTAPILGDRFMFFGKTKADGNGSIHHLQPGQIQEAPETFELSRRLKQYISGDPVEIKVANDPDFLYIRNSGDNHLKVYAYQDAANGERVLSAWSRWTFHTLLGELLSVTSHNGSVFLTFFAQDQGVAPDGTIRILKINALPGDEPFLDCWVSGGDVGDFASFAGWTAALHQAWDRDGNYAGGDTTPTAGVLYEGLPFVSGLTLTSPFATDRDGLPILVGRTTVNTVKVWTEDTSGFQWALRAQGQADGVGAWVVPTGSLFTPTPATTLGDYRYYRFTASYHTSAITATLTETSGGADNEFNDARHACRISDDGLTFAFALETEDEFDTDLVVYRRPDKASPWVLYDRVVGVDDGNGNVVARYMAMNADGTRIALVCSRVSPGYKRAYTLVDNGAGFDLAPGVPDLPGGFGTLPGVFADGFAQNTYRDMAMTPDGSKLFMIRRNFSPVSGDIATYEWDATTGNFLLTLTQLAATVQGEPICAVWTNSDGTLLAINDTNTQVSVYEATAGVWALRENITSVGDGFHLGAMSESGEGLIMTGFPLVAGGYVGGAGASSGCPMYAYNYDGISAWAAEAGTATYIAAALPVSAGYTVNAVSRDGTTICVLDALAGAANSPIYLLDLGIEQHTQVILAAPEPAYTGPIWGATSGVVASSEPVNDLNGVGSNGSAFVNGEYRAYNETTDTGSIASLAPYDHASASIPIGRETREYRLTLESYLWAPLTIKSVEWIGQLFYRARRL